MEVAATCVFCTLRCSPGGSCHGAWPWSSVNCGARLRNRLKGTRVRTLVMGVVFLARASVTRMKTAAAAAAAVGYRVARSR